VFAAHAGTALHDPLIVRRNCETAPHTCISPYSSIGDSNWETENTLVAGESRSPAATWRIERGLGVVQTELVDQEYDLLPKSRRKKRYHHKTWAARGRSTMGQHTDPISEDPLLKIEPIKTGVRTDSSKLDRLLYGKRG
jgi:hypothetical protein